MIINYILKDSFSPLSVSEEVGDVIQYSLSLPAIWFDARAEKVFPIDCFHFFHEVIDFFLNECENLVVKLFLV
jgi:hypothetical protein